MRKMLRLVLAVLLIAPAMPVFAAPAPLAEGAGGYPGVRFAVRATKDPNPQPGKVGHWHFRYCDRDAGFTLTNDGPWLVGFDDLAPTFGTQVRLFGHVRINGDPKNVRRCNVYLLEGIYIGPLFTPGQVLGVLVFKKNGAIDYFRTEYLTTGGFTLE